MREIDPELQARLDGGATRLCRCWRVRRRDETEFGFTDHDEDVTFDGTVFRASTGLDASALESVNGLSVDNGQAFGALTDAGISERDVRSGRFDGAVLDHWLVDWERPALRVLMFRGSFGEIRRKDGAFEVELRGLAEALNAAVGRTILRRCDRAVGGAKCGFNLEAEGFSTVGEASAGSGADMLLASGLAGFAEGWFSQGVIRWLSGPNSGETSHVKADARDGTGRRLFLWQEPGEPLAAGHRFRVTAGCDKRAETCQAKFKNFLNFRGFPHIPGEDWVAAYPKDGAIHDGSSQQQ